MEGDISYSFLCFWFFAVLYRFGCFDALTCDTCYDEEHVSRVNNLLPL